MVSADALEGCRQDSGMKKGCGSRLKNNEDKKKKGRAGVDSGNGGQWQRLNRSWGLNDDYGTQEELKTAALGDQENGKAGRIEKLGGQTLTALDFHQNMEAAQT